MESTCQRERSIIIHSKPACLVFIILLLSFSACANKEALKRDKISPFQGTATIEALKQAIGFGDVAGLKALAEVSITNRGEDKGVLNGVFAYKPPDKMRVDLFGPFGLTMSELVISNGLLQLFVPSKKSLYEWNLPEIAFSGLTSSRLRYEMTVDGEFYVLVAYMPDELSHEVAAKYYFDGIYLLNRTIYFFKDGSAVMKTEFSDFNGRVPERMRLTLSNGLELNIALQEPKIDADIPEEYFRVIEHGEKQIKSFQEIIGDFAPVR